MVSGCLAALSCGTWTKSAVSWTSAIISTAELEQLSTDRDTWESACANGLAIYNVSAYQATEDRRTRRHNPANPPTTVVRDAHSAAEYVLLSSACAAIYGVMPHVHISNTPSSTNVIDELDGLLRGKQTLCAVFSRYNETVYSIWNDFQRSLKVISFRRPCYVRYGIKSRDVLNTIRTV